MDLRLPSSASVKDLRIHVSTNLTWKVHVEEQIMEANSALLTSQACCNECTNEDQTWALEIFFNFVDVS